MSELAFNYQGQRFVPPSEAVYWRVRRIRDGQRGQLDIVRDAEGLPLVVPLDIGIDDFRAAVDNQAGRYRLDALSEDKMAMRDVPAAYVNVPAQRRPAGLEPRVLEREPAAPEVLGATPTPTVTAPFGTWPALPMPMGMSGTEYLLAEALRGQVQMFQMLTTALSERVAGNATGTSQMLGAAAELVRAADGAAMPRRRPLPEPVTVVPAVPTADLGARNAALAGVEDELGADDATDEEAEGAEKGEVDVMIDKLGRVMTAIGPAVPHLVSLVRGYPPAPGATAAPRNAGPSEPDADDEEEDDDGDELDVTPTMVSHMILLAQQLGEDGPLLRRVLRAMDGDERRALIQHLCALPIEDALSAASDQLAPVKARMAKHARSASKRRTGAPHAEVEPEPEPDEAEAGVDSADLSSDAVPGEVAPADSEDDLDREAAEPAPTKAELDAHMLQIARHLTLPEMLQAQSLVTTIPDTERTAWIQKLIGMAPADAATVVRVELARRAGA